MLDLVTPSPVNRIASIVGDVLSRRGVEGPIGSEAELARFGLTSIDMVEVMLGVEAEFDLAIPPGDIAMENFRSVDAMARLVARLRPVS